MIRGVARREKSSGAVIRVMGRIQGGGLHGRMQARVVRDRVIVVEEIQTG